MKQVLKSFCPPIIMSVIRQLTEPQRKNGVKYYEKGEGSQQDLDIYWTEDMANQLENWGRNHTWIEIECLLANCRGKVLDIACGTGVNIISLSKFDFLEIHGFDISSLLLQKAKQKGIDPRYLQEADATKTNYSNNEFDYSYSIGSLEHFTEEGIDAFLKESSRYTSKGSFHMIPISENNKDHGWIKRGQSYFNNSLGWWLPKFQKHFRQVYIINSGWKDEGISVGKWFVCFK